MMLADEVMGDGVKRAAENSAPSGGHRNHRAGPLKHLSRGSPGEREQQDPLGLDTAADEPSHPRTKGRRLAGARAGEDQQRSAWVAHRALLLRVQGKKPLRFWTRAEGGELWPRVEHAFLR